MPSAGFLSYAASPSRNCWPPISGAAMPCTRAELEKRERLILAGYAQLSSESRGRQYKEEPPEQKYPQFPGLNLTGEVREGLSKHAGALGKTTKTAKRDAHSLEAQVADIGDEIAYYSHDLDDGLTSGLLSEARLARDVPIWAEAALGVKRAYRELADECRRYFIIRCIIDSQVKDVVETTERNI